MLEFLRKINEQAIIVIPPGEYLERRVLTIEILKATNAVVRMGFHKFEGIGIYRSELWNKMEAERLGMIPPREAKVVEAVCRT